MSVDFESKQYVEVSFRVAGQTFLFDAGTLQLEEGTEVVCETEHGHAMGTVIGVAEPDTAPPANFQPLRILRAANEEDHRLHGINQRRSRHALEYCKELIATHQLPMKLVGAEYVLKGNKLLFFFSAEGRIDFRKLVRELARYFQMRIEMRQIGVRDSAKLLGGLGPCGQELCCSRFLRKFTAVSVRMAKDQSLSLNPQKITGVCGRLMCCLAYEQSLYQSARKLLPKVGMEVDTPTGKGKIRTIHPLTQKANVIFLNETPVREEEYAIHQLKGYENFPSQFEKQESVESAKIAREAENRSHYSVEPLMESRRPGAKGFRKPHAGGKPAGTPSKGTKPPRAGKTAKDVAEVGQEPGKKARPKKKRPRNRPTKPEKNTTLVAEEVQGKSVEVAESTESVSKAERKGGKEQRSRKPRSKSNKGPGRGGEGKPKTEAKPQKENKSPEDSSTAASSRPDNEKDGQPRKKKRRRSRRSRGKGSTPEDGKHTSPGKTPNSNNDSGGETP